MIEQVNQSYIAYNPHHDIHIREYYLYCVSLIKSHLLSCNSDLNVILGPYHATFPNQNKTIRIDLQVEHTLVKEGGRSVDEVVYGAVQYDGDKRYLVRIPNYNYYNSLDYIIEYSQPNIYNISTNSSFNNYLKKVLHIYPTLYDINLDDSERTHIVCLFSGWNSRRSAVLDKMHLMGIDVQNVKDCYDKSCLCNLYSKTKIVVNVHQTDHHDTFEELRVLPALLNGAIIVSEEVPLKDQIMYSDLIVWSNYNDLPAKVLEVSDNYDKYHNEIFGGTKIKKYIDQMRNINYKNISLIE